jgi:lipoyl(octanoyl) transferase
VNESERRGYLLRPGVMDYEQAWALQRRLAQARAGGHIPDSLILLQHPHTYTLGRSGRVEHLLIGEAERREKGIRVYEVDRGGDVTYHGPGQLVGYPILYLGRPGANGHLPQVDYVAYLRRIEEVIIRALAAWGIVAERSPGYTGVWVQTEDEPVKVAAIGVKVDGRGISQHGFALNVDPDLAYFDGIVPCGIHDRAVTSMARLLARPPALDDVATVVAQEFGAVFGLCWHQVSLAEIPIPSLQLPTPALAPKRSAGASVPNPQ